MNMAAIFVIIICVGIIFLGLWLFIGIIMKASKGKSSCGSCKKCSEEFCSQRREEFNKKK